MTSTDSPKRIAPVFAESPEDASARKQAARAAEASFAPLVQPESPVRRILFGLLLAAVLLLYAKALYLHWYPANPGVDQNGYLVGGRLLAQTGSDGYVPENPYSFVGAMWNLGPDGRTFYPKYPLGLPALYALCVKTLGLARGTYVSYFVSPLGAVLAVWGTYFLARPYVGAFGAILASMILAVSPLTMALANNPNSHASTLAFVTWGMVFLLSWWRSGGAVRAGLAGFLLGYALTIRYTEGLLLLPMTIVFIDRWFRRQPGAYWQGLVMACGWAIPVGVLLWFNLVHFGSPTGYDSTRESMGFSWTCFVANWDLMLRDMNDKALVLVFPLGLAGLGLMTSKPGGWRLAIILASWIFPCLLTYSAYYWAPDGTNLAYARFFLTVLPGVLVAAMWTLTRSPLVTRPADPAAPHAIAPTPWRGAVLAAGLIGLLATAASAAQDAETVIPDSRANMLVDLSSSFVRRAPPGSVVFTQQQLIHHLQFVSDVLCYAPEMFNRGTIQRFAVQADVDDPNPQQPQRAAALYAKLKDKTDAQLILEQNEIMDRAIASGKHVYFVAPAGQINNYKSRFLRLNKYATKVVNQWTEPSDWRRTRWQRTANGVAPSWTGRRGKEPPPPGPGQTWQMIEVLPKPPAPTPPPKPDPKPAAKPALKANTTKPAVPEMTPEERAKRRAAKEQRKAAASQPTSRPTPAH